jgi:hypothetical protein
MTCCCERAGVGDRRDRIGQRQNQTKTESDRDRIGQRQNRTDGTETESDRRKIGQTENRTEVKSDGVKVIVINVGTQNVKDFVVWVPKM